MAPEWQDKHQESFLYCNTKHKCYTHKWHVIRCLNEEDSIFVYSSLHKDKIHMKTFIGLYLICMFYLRSLIVDSVCVHSIEHNMIYSWVLNMHQQLLTSAKLHKNSLWVLATHKWLFASASYLAYVPCVTRNNNCGFPSSNIRTHEWNCKLSCELYCSNIVYYLMKTTVCLTMTHMNCAWRFLNIYSYKIIAISLSLISHIQTTLSASHL